MFLLFSIGEMFRILNRAFLLLVFVAVVARGAKVTKFELNQTSKIVVGKKGAGKPSEVGDLKQIGSSCCNSFPCQNGGTCYVTSFGYVCSCPLGITGNNCQISRIHNKDLSSKLKSFVLFYF